MNLISRSAIVGLACLLSPTTWAAGVPATTASQHSMHNDIGDELDDAWLTDYRARFDNAKTARDMQAFITQYQTQDPESRVPRAQLRLRTFTAFEQALATRQCTRAQQLHQRISGYKLDLPFSLDACKQPKPDQAINPEEVYVAGVRLQDDGELASARTLFRSILDRFPHHPVAVKAADRLAHLSEIEALHGAHKPAATSPETVSRPLTPKATRDQCPSNLSHIRSKMVFPELRENPSFNEPIEDIISKAGGLDAAIAELQRLVRENERPLSQAAETTQQYRKINGPNPLAFRCKKPNSNFCSANYYYHMLKEGAFYYAELLNSLQCRKTGQMEHAQYQAAPLNTSAMHKDLTQPASKK